MNSLFLPRKTISRTVERTGVGIFTGEECRVVMKPGTPGTGIVFSLPAGQVEARVENVETGPRYSALHSDGTRVLMVEHLLSAISAYGVTDLIIECTAPELPFFDGSAAEWADALVEAGLQVLEGEVQAICPRQPIVVSDGDQTVVVVPHPHLAFGYFLDYPGVGSQWAYFPMSAETYRSEIAPARSFISKREYDEARAAGYFRRATADAGILFDNGRPHTELRFVNEPARHKVLDMIGDFALSGSPQRALIIGTRSGHRLNHRALRTLLSQIAADPPER
jgi:UDP-3-O-acyl N-acetylglucosamine deacetylase